MDINNFMAVLDGLGADFFTGVPDSLLRPFTDYIMRKYGVSANHVVAANEGAAVGLAAGHYLATSKPAVVYMQNSGIGNAVNPVSSLIHKKIYAIPVIFVIGWRGEPGVKDEPQHLFQGEITLSLLDCLEIPYTVIAKDTEYSELSSKLGELKDCINGGQSVAFVIKNNALQNKDKYAYHSGAELSREQTLRIIMDNADKNDNNDVYICTTGKLSREVFELRENAGRGHERDFLTVGSMGHSIMIAYGVALSKPGRRVVCLDGDGAAVMHLGSLAVTGVSGLANILHIVINNGAHETVGGIPVVSAHLNLSETALTLGYRHAYRVADEDGLRSALNETQALDGPVFMEVMCNLESRADLGRPTTTPIQNKNSFMSYLMEEPK